MTDGEKGMEWGTSTLRQRSPHMLKLAAVLLALMILFGVLGFVVNVAGAITKAAFFVCLIALAVSLVMKAMKKG